MGFVNARSDVRTQQVMSKMTKTASGAIEITGDIQITGALEAQSIGTTLLNTIFPIGSIYFTASAVNPSTSIGGTWQRYAQGKCLFSVDDNDADFVFEAEGGQKERTLNLENIPSHTHNYGDRFRWNLGGDVAVDTSSAGARISNFQFSTAATGGDANGDTIPFITLPPYVSVYCWKRTS